VIVRLILNETSISHLKPDIIALLSRSISRIYSFLS